MPLQTVLHSYHQQSDAKMVDFSGWEMPLNYGSQIEEHMCVRQAAGLFDVSHMLVTDLCGKEVRAFLRKILANDVAKLETAGTALYSCMLNDQGGILDDLIVYFIDHDQYRIVSNAGTREKVSRWLSQQAEKFDLVLTQKDDVSIIAVQGPDARRLLSSVLNESAELINSLSSFQCFTHDQLFIACTGYTGEDGFEIILPNKLCIDLWNALLDAGAKQIGLGARDSLRLEAGMSLYGSEMDETTTPLETGLGWTVSWTAEDRNFIGRTALLAQKQAGVPHKRIGLVLNGKGVCRAHQQVFIGQEEIGKLTSGGYSPVLEKSIALARVDTTSKGEVEIQIRKNRVPASIVKLPFI